MTEALAVEFETHRPRLFGLAYRMLGSAQEAEDAVQDAYLRWNGAERAAIAHPAAWLAKVVTNLCLNRLTSARATREEYPGPWLPEPVLTGDGTAGPLGPFGAPGPLESAERREAVSLALLLLLERLTPVERAVYVLREAFAYSHREIAAVLEVSEANSRQLYRRAAARVAAVPGDGPGGERVAAVPGDGPDGGRAAVSGDGPGGGRAAAVSGGGPHGRRAAVSGGRPVAGVEQHRGLVESFLTAAREGDLAGLEKLLAAGVTYTSDGGGVVSAARRPILGREKVLRFLAGGLDGFAARLELVPAEVNGAAALLALDGGTLVGTITFETSAEAGPWTITGMHAVVNPAKLAFAARQLSHSGRPTGSPP